MDVIDFHRFKKMLHLTCQARVFKHLWLPIIKYDFSLSWLPPNTQKTTHSSSSSSSSFLYGLTSLPATWRLYLLGFLFSSPPLPVPVPPHSPYSSCCCSSSIPACHNGVWQLTDRPVRPATQTACLSQPAHNMREDKQTCTAHFPPPPASLALGSVVRLSHLSLRGCFWRHCLFSSITRPDATT